MPDKIEGVFLAIYTKFVLRAKYTRIFDQKKDDNGKIRVDTNILIMQCIVLNKNK
jgi:hypothetical protein